ncbi:MAG: pyridoxal-dependent decarboxylase [Planctomycetota bacterium]
MSSPNHLSPDDFQRLGHRMVDWIADYWRTVEQRRVLPDDPPGAVAAKLPETFPETPAGDDEWGRIFADLDEIVAPGLTHWQHPGFFAYFPANASFPAILADLLCAGTGVQGMLWSTGPAVTEIETRVLDWTADLLGLPEPFRSTAAHDQLGGGVIQGTASESTLTTLVAARARALRADPGADASRLTLYTSTQAHSSVVKAAIIAGLARDPEDHTHLRLVPVDRELRMRPDALERMLREDTAAGKIPFWIGATCGTTASTAIDPLPAIAAARDASSARAWIHVDAAFSGASCVCPEFRWQLDGIGRCESVVVNAHKWLLTNFDCSMLWTQRRRDLTSALSITPEYLRNEASDAGAVIDYRDWQIPLGRRFRALKLWFVMRHYGAEGLRSFIREHVEWASRFESKIDADERFVLAAPRTTSLVCFACAAGDDATRELHKRLNDTGELFVSHAVLPVIDDRGEQTGSRYVIRFAVGGTSTRERHVDRAWSLIDAEAQRVLAEAVR